MSALRGPERLWLALSGAGYAVMSLVWFFIPARRFHLYREGNVVETITAVLFLAAAVMTVAAMRRAGLRWCHPYALIVPMALFCFAEESSWARHELDIDPPRVLGVRVDAVHDLLTLAFALYVQHGSWRSRLTVGLGAAIVVAVGAAARHRVLYPLARVVLASPVWRLVAVAVGLIGLSLALDTDLLPWRYFKPFEEMTELNAALALFLASLQINKGADQSPKRRPQPAREHPGQGGRPAACHGRGPARDAPEVRADVRAATPMTDHDDDEQGVRDGQSCRDLREEIDGRLRPERRGALYDAAGRARPSVRPPERLDGRE